MHKQVRFTFFIVLWSVASFMLWADEQEPYQRLIRKGARLASIKEPNRIFILKKDHLVWVKNIFGDELFVHVLSKSGMPLYKTSLSSVTSFNKVNRIYPLISPLEIYENIALDQEALPTHEDSKWSTFANFGIEQSSSSFYKNLLSGSKESLTGLRAQVKQYYVYHKLPVHLGIQASVYRQAWSDEASGNATIFNSSWGPTFMTSFWRKNESAYNIHLSFFRSLSNQVSFNAEKINLTTIGYQLELEKEFLVKGKPLVLGAHYRFNKHNVDDLDPQNQYIDEGDEQTFGLTLGYRFDWVL